jgi:hypothetical protein
MMVNRLGRCSEVNQHTHIPLPIITKRLSYLLDGKARYLIRSEGSNTLAGAVSVG